MTLTVGLFGTCGASMWREPFKTRYDADLIHYFDPQVADWKPSDAEIEAEHLATDEIILFPVTGESYGFGSLAESGFSIMQAIRQADVHRFVIVMIDLDLEQRLHGDQEQAKASLRARALVLAHLQQNPQRNVFVVRSLDEMLTLSLILVDVCTHLSKLHTQYSR